VPLELDVNRVIDNLSFKIAELTKRITFLEVENQMLKEESNKTNQEG
jgi:FtsZ-binding cell division protein ZapB